MGTPGKSAKAKATKATTKPKPKAKPKPSEKYVSGWDNSENIWTPLNYASGSGANSATPAELANGLDDIVYSCVDLISTSVASEACKFKLVSTATHNTKQAKSLDRGTCNAIAERYGRHARKAVALNEIVDHGLLDLLDKPNPVHSFRNLLEWTDVYMELVGSAFWFVAGPSLNGHKIPAALWLLPSQNVTIESEDGVNVDGYRVRSGDDEKFYKPCDIIHFRNTIDPANPYAGFGLSPLKAVWDRVQLLKSEQASWGAVLQNLAFPSALVSPPENEDYTPGQAQRIRKQLDEMFRYGNQGGLMVVQDGMKFTPISTPPKDLAALSMYDQIRTSVCAAYRVPRQLLDLTDTGTEASDVTRRSFQQYCLVPRIEAILETISDHLCPPQTFLAAAGIISPDRVFDLQRTTALVAGNIITVNEGRQEQGYEPMQGYDRLMNQLVNVGTPSAQTFQNAIQPARTKAVTTYHSTAPDPLPLQEVLVDLFGKLEADALSKLKQINGISTKAFLNVSDWTALFAENLNPILAAYFDDGAKSLIGSLGGSFKLLPVKRLAEACNNAVLALADSTLNTTGLAVSDAVEATRQAIRDGLGAGEAHASLASRVSQIFTGLKSERAVLIAETESSRAKHFGEALAIEETGVAAKKRWLPDSMACERCRECAAQGAIPLNEPYHVDAKGGHYAVTKSPPRHPGCRCSQVYDLED